MDWNEKFLKGDSLKLKIRPIRGPRPKPVEPVRFRGQRQPFLPDDDLIEGVKIRFFDLGTRFSQVDPNLKVGWALVLNSGVSSTRSTEPNLVNGYAEKDIETILITQLSDQMKIRNTYLEDDPFGSSPASLSGRSIHNCWPLYHPCGDLFLDAYFYKRGDVGEALKERHYTLQQGSQDWHQRIDVDTRLASFEGIKSWFTNPIAKEQADDILGELELEKREKWLSLELGLLHNEGVLQPRALPDRYDLRMNSPYYYEPIDTNDTINYKYTSEPNFFSSDVVIPRLRFGENFRADIGIYLVPQFWQVKVFYFAWYLFVTFWAFTYVRFPAVFTYHNRFPLFPRPFALGSTDYAPIWNWIERSQQHQLSAARDLAVQFFTPFMAMVFLFTSDGRYEIRRVNTFPGALVGVVKFGEKRYYIWRRTVTNRDLTTSISEGPVNTYWINSFNIGVTGTLRF